jgi:hypothetical protein
LAASALDEGDDDGRGNGHRAENDDGREGAAPQSADHARLDGRRRGRRRRTRVGAVDATARPTVFLRCENDMCSESASNARWKYMRTLNGSLHVAV